MPTGWKSQLLLSIILKLVLVNYVIVGRGYFYRSGQKYPRISYINTPTQSLSLITLVIFTTVPFIKLAHFKNPRGEV